MARRKRQPRCIVIAGPNGAGKTTFARRYLPNNARVIHFVNADLIAAGLSPLKPELASIAAARTVLAEIDRLAASGELDAAAGRAVALLQARVLLIAAVNPEGQVGIAAGPAPAQLMQGGYRLFLARVDNPGLVPGKLTASSPESVPLNGLRPGRPNYASVVPGQEIATSPGDVAVRWLDLDVFDSAALPAELLPVTTDFKLLQLYARAAGRRTARVRIDVGAGRNDLGEHDALTVAFDVLPAHTVRLAVRDEDGAAVTCSLLVTDAVGRVYPSQTRRPLPDLYFQNKVYRAEGETLSLPSGEFRVVAGRGPEYLLETARLRVALQGETHWEFHLKRWIDPRRRGWYSRRSRGSANSMRW